MMMTKRSRTPKMIAIAIRAVFCDQGFFAVGSDELGRCEGRPEILPMGLLGFDCGVGPIYC